MHHTILGTKSINRVFKGPKSNLVQNLETEIIIYPKNINTKAI